MRICLDCRMIGPYMHGISRYALNLVMGLADLDLENEYILLVRNPAEGDLLPQKDNFALRVFDLPLYDLREQLLLPRLLRRLDVDIFHSPTFSAPILQPCRTIMTIHDLIHVLFPDDYSFAHRAYYRLIVKRAANRARRVLTVSKASRGDLISSLGLRDEKVTVIPNGVDPRFRPLSGMEEVRRSIETKWGIRSPFLLWVGNPKPHKNLKAALLAFRALVQRACSLHLVAVGVGRQHGLAATPNKAFLERVAFIPHASDDEMIALYNAADLLLHPSLYEGFGLPVLEAMACGTPVIASNTSSLPEVVGDAAIMVDPSDIEALAEAMHRVLTDSELREEMRRRGLERAKLFSWEETGRRTLKVYEEVYAEGKR